MSGRRRTLAAMLMLVAVGSIASSAATSHTSGVTADVSPESGAPACVSSHLVGARGSGTRTPVACDLKCSYVDFRLVCVCKLQLTVACSVRCTVKCSRNRTYYTVGYAHTSGDNNRQKGLRRCLKVAEGNARASAFISYPKCRVTACRPLTGFAKPKIARSVSFTMPGAYRL
jgi:hypothetical protein